MNYRIFGKVICFFSFFALSQSIFSQKFTWLDSANFSLPDQISADRYGNFYLADSQGNIHQFDSLGKEKLRFSPEKIGSISLLDARSTVRIFAFYRDFQEVIILDRFLKKIESYSLENSDLGFVRLLAPSADNRWWVLTDTDFSLQKYDPRTRQLLFKIPLQLVLPAQNYDFIFLAEYQNWLFLQDRAGTVLMFDNMGNFRQIFKLGVENAVLSFWKNSLYYGDKTEIKAFDFYTQKTERYFLGTTFLEKYFQIGTLGFGFGKGKMFRGKAF